jgi:Nucleotidyltransferase domain
MTRTAEKCLAAAGGGCLRAVAALGGSRVTGTARPDSDWDFSLYYRGPAGPFDPETLRTLGWPGDVFPLGSWGGGVFNSGAWLRAGGRAGRRALWSASWP